MSKWTDEQVRSVLESFSTETLGPSAWDMACALLDARERADKAEAINAELRQQATASRENASNLAVQLGDAREQVAAERAHADRLAEALRFYNPAGPYASLLAAHDARRAGEGR